MRQKILMAKSKSSEWMRRHVSDVFVKQAQRKGYRSRAAFKLLEMQEKYKIIKPGMTIVDLGAAPGGWTQVAANIVGDNGRVIATDLLPMDSYANMEFFQGDFREQEVFDQIQQLLGDQKADLVISDMAPNISGVKAIDQPKAMYLAELALDLAAKMLKPEGDFLVKVFQGEGIDSYRNEAMTIFSQVMTRKPKASRAESREVYLLGRKRIV